MEVTQFTDFFTMHPGETAAPVPPGPVLSSGSTGIRRVHRFLLWAYGEAPTCCVPPPPETLPAPPTWLLRDQLDLAVGSAVGSTGDAELITRWLSADMGSADVEAVEVLGRLVGRGDARYLAFGASAVG